KVLTAFTLVKKSVLLDPPQNKSDGGGSKGILGMHQLFDHVDLTGPLVLDTARLVYGDVSPDSRSDLMHDSHSVLGGKKLDRESTRLNSSHVKISYAVFCLKKKKKKIIS